jgi:hypothetical protein
MVTSSQTGCRRSQRMLRPPPEREGLCHCPAGWNAPITGRLQATARLENHIFPTIVWERSRWMAPWDHFQRGSQGTAALTRRQPHVRASVFFQQDRLHGSLNRRVERQRLRGGRRGQNRRRDVRLPASRFRTDHHQRRITTASARPSTGSLPRPFHGQKGTPSLHDELVRERSQHGKGAVEPARVRIRQKQADDCSMPLPCPFQDRRPLGQTSSGTSGSSLFP